MSDYEVEEEVSDRISFSYFVGISIDGSVSDQTVISRFRTTMTKAKAYDKLLDLINKQWEHHKILVRTGVIVDASITDTPESLKAKRNMKLLKIATKKPQSHKRTCKKT